MWRTSNPALNEKTFSQFEYAGDRTMTLQGTVNKTGLLLAVTVIAASWTWYLCSSSPSLSAGAAKAFPWMIGGAIAGLIFSLITAFKATWSPVTGPIYCVCQGLFLGGISAIMEARFPNIVFQAVGLTFGTLASLLFAYTSRLIRATENFKLGVVAATGAIFLFYLVDLVLGLCGVQIPHIHGNGWIGIAISLFVVGVAALNLVLDFDFIENGANRGAPKYMEWYAAFGLMVTLIWLYVEILRLLSKLRSRN